MSVATAEESRSSTKDWIWLAVGAQPVLGENGRTGDYFMFGVTKRVFDNAPRWQKDQAFPPLSPWRAQAAALAEARRIRPEVTKWETQSFSLVPFVPFIEDQVNPYYGYWYYTVTLHRADRGVGGQPESLIIPVLMDGSAAHPKIVK